MEKKTKIIICSILIIAILLVVIAIYFKATPNPGRGIELTDDKLITNQTLIDLIVNQKISPMGNNLTESTLDEDDPNIMDDSWKYSYYVCADNEHEGWIYIYSGNLGKSGLYGPYGWCFI